jgi:predicted dithiol-disulfide oxidoreductase (DUF899 family)
VRYRLRSAPMQVAQQFLAALARDWDGPVYRAFFEPGAHGWPGHACIGCSLVADQVAHVAHLNARDTTLAFVSRAPLVDPPVLLWLASAPIMSIM